MLVGVVIHTTTRGKPKKKEVKGIVSKAVGMERGVKERNPLGERRTILVLSFLISGALLFFHLGLLMHLTPKAQDVVERKA